MAIHIKTFFDPQTKTLSHVIHDITSKNAAIIDSVLDYDPYSGSSHTYMADQIINYIRENALSVEWILDTHIHADHITGAHYLKTQLGGKIGIGSRIKEVLALWVPIFNIAHDTPLDGSQFDCLLEDEDILPLGESFIKVLHTPGHTPACVSYLIDDSVFVGDTIFMPDVGTARTDFPGGSAHDLYRSLQKILSLPEDTKIYMCHDYPPNDRQVSWVSSVKEEKENNILINFLISEQDYVTLRTERDKGKAVPTLLLPSIQVNLRAGTFGSPESNNRCYIKIPIDFIKNISP